MEISNIITIIVYILSIGVSWGVITSKVSKQAEEIKKRDEIRKGGKQ